MKIHFRNVGREKKCWQSEVDDLSDDTVLAEIRKANALRSQGIDLSWNSEGTGGAIYVGLFRKVGDYWVEGGARLF
jgi:hypothetical protein